MLDLPLLITGANGQVGGAVARLARDRGIACETPSRAAPSSRERIDARRSPSTSTVIFRPSSNFRKSVLLATERLYCTGSNLPTGFRSP